MNKTISLDYETFYDKKDYSVSDLGNWRYCNDERFDPFLLTAYDGQNAWAGHPKDFNWEAVRGAKLVAHTAAFDSAVTRRVVELGMAPEFVLENEWQCTANLSSCLAGTRALKNAARTLLGRQVNKKTRDDMNKLHWADIEAKGMVKEVVDYAVADAINCHDLWTQHSPKWNSLEQQLSSLTIKQCARGVRINTELLEEYRLVLIEVIFNLEQSFPWTERGAKPTSPIAIAEECRKHGIPAPPVKTHDEEGFEVWTKTYGPRFEWVYGAGQWRSLRKLLSSIETVKERLRPDGTIDFSLLYFGAHTGRWSGGGSGFNLQNLRKIPLFLKNKNVVNPPPNLTFKAFKEWVAACTDYALDIRRLLVARPGKKFICADLSQIEPRVLAWLVGNKPMLDLLVSGMNIYEAFARVSMNWRGGKLKDENLDLYQLAKIQVLGLGYGCGWDKFITIASEYFVTLDEAQSRELVTSFRANNPLIANRDPQTGPVGIWASLDDAFRRSVNSDFAMTLPSGRRLVYRDVAREVRSKKNTETGKYEKRFVFTAATGDKRVETYGGKLTENLVQAVARDVFGEHLITLEDQIGDVIFHVHDEAITEVDLDVTVKDVEHVMAKTPEWCEGLPVSAEAKETMFYMKG